jgi:hypothetical protein
MRDHRRLLLSVGIWAVAAGAAQATPIISSLTGLAAPDVVVDFSEMAVPADAALTNQFAALGVTFSGFFYNGCDASCATARPAGAKPDITNFNNEEFVTGPFSPIASLSFAAPVRGAAFAWASNRDAYTFRAYLGATLLEDFSVVVNTSAINGSNGWGYYGFDGIMLDRITIESDNAFLIDDLEVGTSVPEPATLLLLGAGLLAGRRHFRSPRG